MGSTDEVVEDIINDQPDHVRDDEKAAAIQTVTRLWTVVTRLVAWGERYLRNDGIPIDEALHWEAKAVLESVQETVGTEMVYRLIGTDQYERVVAKRAEAEKQAVWDARNAYGVACLQRDRVHREVCQATKRFAEAERAVGRVRAVLEAARLKVKGGD